MQQRIIQIMKNYGLTAGQFAEKLGVQPSNISHILAGRNKPSLDFVSRILIVFPEIDYQWLIFGKGAMLQINNEFEKLEINNTNNDYTNKTYNNTKKEGGDDELIKSTIEPEESEIDLFHLNPQEAKKIDTSPLLPSEHNDTTAQIHTNEMQQNKVNKELKAKTENHNSRTKVINKIIILFNDGSYEER